jgi:hypothetical protein
MLPPIGVQVELSEGFLRVVSSGMLRSYGFLTMEPKLFSLVHSNGGYDEWRCEVGVQNKKKSCVGGQMRRASMVNGSQHPSIEYLVAGLYSMLQPISIPSRLISKIRF